MVLFTHNLNPTILHLGPLQVRWYGLFYLLGFFIFIFMMRRYAREGKLKLNDEQIWDFAYACLLGILIGSRLYEVLVWDPAYYFSQPWKILAIWEGGLAYHGGVLGIIVAAYWFARKHKLSFLHLADLASPPLAFALGFGRIGNFINGEIWGPVTTVPWCVVYEGVCRHPYQLYGAFKRWLVSGVLFKLSAKKHPEGAIFFHFLWMMGLGRVILDFWRVDTLYFGLSIGQWSSMVMVLIGIMGLSKIYRETAHRDPS